MLPDANPTTHSLPPREPEIEFLRKIATFGVVAFRAATVVAGMVAIGYAAVGFIAAPQDGYPVGSFPEAAARGPIARYFVWLCIGMPPLVSTRWLFGRGRWPMLAMGAALWFLPMWLEGDHEYGWLLRFFATVVALSVLFVWKTIFALTQKPVPPA